jgi:hypothetical protein
VRAGNWGSAGSIFFFNFRAERVLGVVVASRFMANIVDGRRVGAWKIFHVGDVRLRRL